MATINLDTIMKAGLLIAFILPAFAIISSTLPPPVTAPGGVNVSSALNHTGAYIYDQFSHTFINTSQTLLGNCGSPLPAGINVSGNTIPISGGTNCSSTGGSFYSSPTIFQAFAFILNNLGVIITDIVQLPYLDFLALQTMQLGMITVLPGVPLAFMSVGINLLYIYMGFSLLLMGIGSVQKYNPKVG